MPVSLAAMADHIRAGMADPNSNWSRIARGEVIPPEPKQPSRWDKREDGRNVAHQYRPAFFSGFPDLEDIPFDTLDELMAIEWVKGWTEGERLKRFSLSRDQPGYHHLMAEMTNGKFWVVAIIDNDVPELPTWKLPK